MLILQFFLRLACFFCLLCLVVFERHDNIGNQDNIRHERCKTTRVCCVAWAKLAIDETKHDYVADP
jgi:hypothetical protein